MNVYVNYRDQGETVLVAGPLVRHLGLTKNGQPKHPLYLKANSERLEVGAR